TVTAGSLFDPSSRCYWGSSGIELGRRLVPIRGLGTASRCRRPPVSPPRLLGAAPPPRAPSRTCHLNSGSVASAKRASPQDTRLLPGFVGVFAKMTSVIALLLDSWAGRCARARSRPGRAPCRSFPETPQVLGAMSARRARRGALWSLARRHSGLEPDP